MAVTSAGVVEPVVRWAHRPAQAERPQDLFFVPSASHGHVDQLVARFVGVANVFVPRASTYRELLAAFDEYDWRYRQDRPVVLLGDNDGARFVGELLRARAGALGLKLVAAYIVGAGTAGSAVPKCATADAVHCVDAETPNLELNLPTLVANLQTRLHAYERGEHSLRRARASRLEHSSLAQDLPLACSSRLSSYAALSASSEQDGHGAAMAAMDGRPDHAWVPVTPRSSWLQYAFNGPKEVHFVQTSAPADADVNGGVVQYKLQYSMDGEAWSWYVSGLDAAAGKGWTVLDGYAEAPEVKMVALDPPVEATFLRLWPTDWKEQPAVRAAVRGCNASDVMAAEFTVNSSYAALFPAKFESEQALRTELRVRIAALANVTADVVQVARVGPDSDRTLVEVRALPNERKPPIEVLRALGEAVADAHGEFYAWLAAAEQTVPQARSCISKDCGPHGQCAAGECFCFEGFGGVACERGPSGGPTAVAAGDGPALEALSPLPVLSSAQLLPDGAGNEEPMSRAALEQSIEEAAADLDPVGEEGGVSGRLKRDWALSGLAVLVLALGLACATYKTKTDAPPPLLEQETAEYPGGTDL